MFRECAIVVIGGKDAAMIAFVAGVAFACSFLTTIFIVYSKNARG